MIAMSISWPGEHAHDLVAVADLQLDLDLGAVVDERHQQRRQQVLGRRDRAHPQRAGEHALQRGHLLAGLAPQIDDAVRVAGQQFARSVSATPRPVRCSSGVPAEASSAAIWIDTAGCVRCSSSAASETLPSLETVWKGVSWRKVALRVSGMVSY
jgi:hypothetical protein